MWQANGHARKNPGCNCEHDKEKAALHADAAFFNKLTLSYEMTGQLLAGNCPHNLIGERSEVVFEQGHT